MGTVFAVNMPFTDVRPTDPYYSAVSELYEGRVISDNGDHLFRPTQLMNRDFFVSLAVGIGCYKCETPNIKDIIKYQISPFIDLPKTNRYYYCVAYAEDNDITQGYITDSNGRASCENGKQYMSMPFCAENTITRIEAAAILLRRANLWNDTLNSDVFDKSKPIPDTSPYWYGYAKKGIEIEIIKQRLDKKIGQDDKITRGEFAIMAARILKYSQCQLPNSSNTIPVEIIVQDQNGTTITKTVFKENSPEVLAVVTTGDWDKKWTLSNPLTKVVLTGSGDTYPIKNLPCGTWINTVELIDRANKNIVSSASNTITIECANQPSSYPISVSISANPLTANNGSVIDFGSIVNGGSGTLIYNWDFGDGTTSGSTNNTTHIYKDNGSYTVTLTITDSLGNTAISSLVVKIIGDIDTDKDGIIDTIDQCPLVYARTTTGCPIIDIYDPSKTSNNSLAAEISVRNSNNVLINKSSFTLGETFSLIPITSTGTWNYRWQATNKTTGDTIARSGSVLPGILFDSIGDWKVILNVIDPETGKIVSSPNMTLDIHARGTTSNTNLSPCAHITANPLTVAVGSTVTLDPTICPSTHTLTHTLDYDDGRVTTDITDITHIYTTPGTYTVTLIVTDTTTGLTGEATVIIEVTPTIPIPPPIIAASIRILNSVGTQTYNPKFNVGENFSLVPFVTTGTGWEYTWTAQKIGTTQIVTGTGLSFPGNKINSAVSGWLVTLNVLDPISHVPVAHPSQVTISILDSSVTTPTTDLTLCAHIFPDPSAASPIGTNIRFKKSVCSYPTPLVYSWTYGDGNISASSGETIHAYTTSDIFPVMLVVRDPNTGKTGTGKVSVEVTELPITTYQPSTTGGGTNNVCLDKYRKSRGLLIGTASCSACPCTNSISIDSPLRSCDIVFPAILSPALDTIYSRGGFYLIP